MFSPLDREVYLFYCKQNGCAKTLASLHRLLSERELASINELTSPRLVPDYVFGKVIPRLLLRFLSGRPAEIKPDIKTGKPRLIGGSGFNFNLAHSLGHLLVGISIGMDVGVDIEAIASEVTAVSAAPAFISAKEMRLLDKTSPGYARAVLRLWTIKEASAKLSGAGICEDFCKLDFSTILASGTAFSRISGMWVATPYVSRDVSAAVAASNKPTEIAVYTLRFDTCCLKMMSVIR